MAARKAGVERRPGGWHIVAMAKTLKRPRDPNRLAKLITDIATGEERDEERTAAQEKAAKGGKKGGTARSAALTPAERSKIASIAASARWKKA